MHNAIVKLCKKKNTQLNFKAKTFFPTKTSKKDSMIVCS
jgi:hypothetical protein